MAIFELCDKSWSPQRMLCCASVGWMDDFERVSQRDSLEKKKTGEHFSCKTQPSLWNSSCVRNHGQGIWIAKGQYWRGGDSLAWAWKISDRKERGDFDRSWEILSGVFKILSCIDRDHAHNGYIRETTSQVNGENLMDVDPWTA
jgi:hypothetical protein